VEEKKPHRSLWKKRLECREEMKPFKVDFEMTSLHAHALSNNAKTLAKALKPLKRQTIGRNKKKSKNYYPTANCSKVSS
jgi:hypothetical protein